MSAENDDEELSAYLDGELDAAARERLAERLRTEPALAERLERLTSASAAFRAHGREPEPLGLAARALAEAKPAPSPRGWRYAFVGFALLIFVLGGVALKKFMPTLFNNVQQMITGAASQMGSGGK